MTPESKMQPNLSDLLLRFVNRPADAASIEAEAGALGEVEPHEVAVGFRADPRLAWQEGLAVLDVMGMREIAKSIAAPSEWAAVVVRQEPTATQPFALANYPQRVRDLTALLQAKNLTELCPDGENRPATQALKSWVAKQVAKGTFAASLLAAAVLRAAHDFDQAAIIVNDLRAKATEKERAALANEEAALLWQRGQVEKAVEIWDRMSENPAVLFNRGMAALFLNQTAMARELLKKAVAALPENDGWHHLGSLYLALAEMRN